MTSSSGRRADGRKTGSAARTLGLVLVLALLSIGGLVGMLLAGGGWDLAFFALTALPLAVASIFVSVRGSR
jgi:uncharacterized protein (UPF0261 family)